MIKPVSTGLIHTIPIDTRVGFSFLWLASTDHCCVHMRHSVNFTICACIAPCTTPFTIQLHFLYMCKNITWKHNSPLKSRVYSRLAVLKINKKWCDRSYLSCLLHIPERFRITLTERTNNTIPLQIILFKKELVSHLPSIIRVVFPSGYMPVLWRYILYNCLYNC